VQQGKSSGVMLTRMPTARTHERGLRFKVPQRPPKASARIAL